MNLKKPSLFSCASTSDTRLSSHSDILVSVCITAFQGRYSVRKSPRVSEFKGNDRKIYFPTSKS